MRWANFRSATVLRDALARNALPMSVLMNSPGHGQCQTQSTACEAWNRFSMHLGQPPAMH